MLVIDSSIIARFTTREEGWESLVEYMETGTTIPFALVELGNVLWKKRLRNEVSDQMAIVMLETFSTDFSFLDQNRHLSHAFGIARDNRLSFYDSLFIATAIGQGYDLLTCDSKQANVARKLGVKVIEV